MGNKSRTVLQIATALVAMTSAIVVGMGFDQALVIGAAVSLCLGWWFILDDRYMRTNLMLLLMLPAVPTYCFSPGLIPPEIEVDWHFLHMIARLVATLCLTVDWYAVISFRKQL